MTINIVAGDMSSVSATSPTHTIPLSTSSNTGDVAVKGSDVGYRAPTPLTNVDETLLPVDMLTQTLTKPLGVEAVAFAEVFNTYTASTLTTRPQTENLAISEVVNRFMEGYYYPTTYGPDGYVGTPL